MRPLAEPEMADTAPVRVELVRPLEHGRVAMRGSQQQQHGVAHGTVDIADAIALFGYLFGGGATPILNLTAFAGFNGGVFVG